MKYDVFLSYSRQDKHLMHLVRERLRGASLTVWTDETLTPGTESWKNAIEEAIHNAAYLVVLLSPTAKKSDWIEKEMDYARVCGVPIIPVLAVGEDERSAIPFELINVQRIDIRDDVDAGLDLLVATLKGERSLPERFSPDQPAISAQSPPSAVSSTSSAVLVHPRLNPHNAYNQIMIAWWLLWHPERLKEHGLHKEDLTFKKIASWIGSYLIWTGFLLAPVGYALGIIDPYTVTMEKSTVMLLISIIYVLLWIVTGLFGWKEGFKIPILLYFISGIGVAASQYIAYSVANVAFNDATTVQGQLYILLLGLMVGFGYGIGFQLANSIVAAALGQAGGTLLFLVASGLLLDSTGGAAVILTVIIAVLTATMIGYELTNHRRSWLNYLVAALFLGTLAALLWLLFLGGWQLLNT